jgi:tRNA nucleotidyltransferase (CCA-adding enzyme)
MQLIKGMHSEFPHLAKERVYEEWRKLLLTAPQPSIGLELLRESGWISWFPEIEALLTCEQSPAWHPEGTVWTHSCRVADAAAQMREHIPEQHREAFVFGALLHDVGKPATTVTPEMVVGVLAAELVNDPAGRGGRTVVSEFRAAMDSGRPRMY